MSTTAPTPRPENAVLGIDVGGTGIKAGVVDVSEGVLVGARTDVPTPQPSTPDAVAEAIRGLVDRIGWDGPVGVTVPSVVHQGITRVAPNIDDSWIGCEVGPLFARHLPGTAVSVLNDADAAGITEARFGAARGRRGLVILLTFGTGIGSAFLVDGRLIPNTEFGHILVRDVDGVSVDESEHLASGAVRVREGWDFERWTPHVSAVLRTIENLLWPSLFVIGGGVSEASAEWFPLLDNRTPVVAASRLNDAGVVGAAVFAAREAGVVDLDDVLTGRADHHG